MNPIYPVYIISKGRAESRQTARSLDYLRVPYHIVIEKQEYDQYNQYIPADKILTLPFANLGQGSIPARNWVWEHAKNTGAKRHWIMDDNIWGFFYSNNNERILVSDGTIFKIAEEYVDRYDNVGIAGLNYRMFVIDSENKPPITYNTRIYSCLLIDNELPIRWRGRYNEDTDLCLRYLKSGGCTILFNVFCCGKTATMTMKGGNSDQLYQDDGREQMADSLVEQHPDVTKKTWKWHRWQHSVDYTPFRNNKLIYRKDYDKHKVTKYKATKIKLTQQELGQYQKYLCKQNKNQQDNQLLFDYDKI